MEFIKFLAALFGPALIGGFIVAQDPPRWMIAPVTLGWLFATIFMIGCAIDGAKYGATVTKSYLLYFTGLGLLGCLGWVVIYSQ